MVTEDKFIIIPCTSIDNRMNKILPSVFYTFLTKTSSEGITGVGDCALVLMSLFFEQVKNNKGIDNLAKKLNMNREYIHDIVDYLVDEGVVIALTYTEHKTWNQELIEREREEEEEILSEAVNELIGKFQSEES